MCMLVPEFKEKSFLRMIILFLFIDLLGVGSVCTRVCVCVRKRICMCKETRLCFVFNKSMAGILSAFS